MKKKIILSTLILAFLLGFGIYSSLKLYSFRNEISLKQEVLEGDFFSTDKAKIKFILSNPGNAYWNTVCTISKKPKTDTLYKKERKDDDFVAHLDYSSRFLGFAWELSGNIMEDYGPYDKDAITKALEEYKDSPKDKVMNIYIDMVKKDEREKTVKLKDYMDYFPLELDSHPAIYNKEIMEDEHFYDRSFGDYFKLPVKDDMNLKCKIDYEIGKEHLSINTKSKFIEPYADQDLFFTHTLWDKKSEQILFSFIGSKNYEIPKEYKGIYLLPLEKDSFDGSSFNDYFFDPKSIKKVYEIEDEEEIENMFLNDKNQLCLITKNPNKCQIKILDGKDFHLLKSIEIEKDKIVEFSSAGVNGIFIKFEDGKVLWIDDESYKIRFTGKMNMERFDQEHAYSMEESASILIEDKLYLLFNMFDSAYLVVLDDKGRQSVVKYSFPVGLDKEITIDEQGYLRGYCIEKASFSER